MWKILHFQICFPLKLSFSSYFPIQTSIYKGFSDGNLIFPAKNASFHRRSEAFTSRSTTQDSRNPAAVDALFHYSMGFWPIEIPSGNQTWRAGKWTSEIGIFLLKPPDYQRVADLPNFKTVDLSISRTARL